MKILTKHLLDYPIRLTDKGGIYKQNHVVKRDNKWLLFAGAQSSERYTECVVHDLDDVQVLGMQMILSYGSKLADFYYMLSLMRIVVAMNGISVSDLARLVYKSEDWIKKILKIKVDTTDICASNAYMVSKLKDPSKWLSKALTISPTEFCLIVLAELRRQR